MEIEDLQFKLNVILLLFKQHVLMLKLIFRELQYMQFVFLFIFYVF
jgi:hypothetical protein